MGEFHFGFGGKKKLLTTGKMGRVQENVESGRRSGVFQKELLQPPKTKETL